MSRFSVKQKIHGGADAWLCLTTLHHRRFLEDVIHIIGMPSGAHIRLRYRKPYVDSVLWHRTLTSTKFDTEIVILVFAASDTKGSIKAAPMRAGTIIRARCEGELFILDVALEDFLFESSGEGELYKKLESQCRSLPKSLSKSKASKGKYLQRIETKSLELMSDSSVVGWEKTAAAFFEIDSAHSPGQPNLESQLPFLYFLKQLAPKSSNLLKKDGCLVLEMGSQTEFEIHTISRPSTKSISNPLGEIMLDLSHSAASFTSTRRVRVDSSRDVKSVGISTFPLFRTTDGHISVRTVLFKYESDEGDDESIAVRDASGTILPTAKRTETVVARFDVPLKIGKLRPFIASLLIAGATSLSVYKFSSQGEFKVIDLMIPTVVFIFTLAGLSMGLIKK